MKIIPNNSIKIGLKFRWANNQTYIIYGEAFRGEAKMENVWLLSTSGDTWIVKSVLKELWKEHGKILGYENITQ